MSLCLENGSKVVIDPINDIIFLDGHELSLLDLLAMARYVLTNTDLKPGDPRLQFLQYVQSMKQVKGYNPGQMRLAASGPALLSHQP